MNELLKQSREIVEEAILQYKPKAIFMMFSGGNDSRAAYEVCKILNVPLTHFVHGVTRTGIQETTSYVRNFAKETGLTYLEADAGDAFEKYIERKGFFGLGDTAHSYAYHLLKSQRFTTTAASLRKRRKGFNILFLSGARSDESKRRKRNFRRPINADPTVKSNIWVDVIFHWDKRNLLDFLHEAPSKPNPVTELLCRSGECLCGTMQSKEEGDEAAYWFPEWGDWRRRMTEKARQSGFLWGWGEEMDEYTKHVMRGNLEMFPGHEFQPACASCHLRHEIHKGKR
jgi:3'-phosphoadenosine 5'-phosphosulfate sulfotransferase (PAPS reductase)/FAD synthetase